MRSPPVPAGWTTRTTLVLTMLLIVGVGITTAAVSGEDFSSSYDGYDDGSTTNVPGHEIQVSGTVKFTGSNAVNPKITVRSSDHTVLDYSSVKLDKGADSSVVFETKYLEDGVRYKTDEIPAGEEFSLTFVVYPVSGLTESEIESAEVFVKYHNPSGKLKQKSIPVTTSISDTPESEITKLEEKVSELREGPLSPEVFGIQIPTIVIWMLAGLGVLVLLLILSMLVHNFVKQVGSSRTGPPK